MQLRSRTSVNVEYAILAQQPINALKWNQLKSRAGCKASNVFLILEMAFLCLTTSREVK
jgi:hypothetical protein